VMAASGAILFGFVIGHMLGNLQVLPGPEAFNGYAEKLRHLPASCGRRARPAGGGHAAHRVRLLADADQSGGPARGLPPAREPRVHLRLAHHALGGRDHPAVHRVPPHALHLRQCAPELRPRRRVPQLRDGLPQPRWCRVLTSWPCWRWGCTSTTGLEHDADAGPEPSPATTTCATPSRRWWPWRWSWATSPSRSPS
jgi:hypothetical protein